MTIRGRKFGSGGSNIEQRAIPLSSIWALATSEFGVIFSPETTTSQSLLDVSTAAQSTPTLAPSPPTGETMTISEAIPISTVTVAQTSFRTTFVTVEFTTSFTPTYAPAASTRTSSSTSTSSSTAVIPVLPSPHSLHSTTSLPAVSLPTFATSVRSSRTASSALPANTQGNTTAPSATADETASHSTSHKHAIIGGLSGAIAGVVLLGIVACCLWRRRKPRFDDDDDESETEKGLRPIVARKWSELTSTSPRAPQRPQTAITRGSSPEPELDGQILRVSLDNWARPYAHDQGYRESQGPTTLRVMNPDFSRPNTPLRPSIETAGSFLKRQRSALAAALYGRPSSRADTYGQSGSRTGSPQRNLQPPASNIDPALSTEFLAPKAVAPSVRSTSTNNSIPVIIQQPPEDPFLTPPDETEERTEYTTKPVPTARPGIAPLQGAAAGMGRTLSHLGSSLNPFRTRSNASVSSRSVSRTMSMSQRSVSTFSSHGDPFMLDRPSLQSNVVRGPAVPIASEMQRARSGNIAMYEGT